MGLHIPTNQVQILCVWTAKLAASVFLVFPARPHLYFSTQADLYFLQGHICISPHRLIRISRLGCNGHKLAKIWISFPNCQRRLNLQHLQLHLWSPLPLLWPSTSSSLSRASSSSLSSPSSVRTAHALFCQNFKINPFVQQVFYVPTCSICH